MFQLRLLFVVLFGFMFITSIALMFVSRHIDTTHALEKEARQQLVILNQLTEEFKQVSDHRSLFARAYIITLQPRWLALFNYAIAVSEGKAPQIDDQSLNYWDNLALDHATIPDVENSGSGVSFLERFQSLDITSYELNQIQRALDMVKKLIEIERRAISNSQRLSNTEGIKQQRAQLMLADKRNFLFDEAYLETKNEAMYTLSDIEHRVITRFKAQANRNQKQFKIAKQIHNTIIGVLLLIIALSFYFLWHYYIWPISRMQKALVAQVDSDNFEFRLEKTYKGELAIFAQAMNRLLGNVNEQLKYSEILKELNLALRGKNSAQELGDEIIEFICHRLSIPLVGLYVSYEDELVRVSGIGYRDGAQTTYHDSDLVYFHAVKMNKKYSIDLAQQYAIDHHGHQVFLKELHYFPLSVSDNCIGLLELGSFYNIGEKEFYWLNFIIRDLSVGLHLARNQELQRKTERKLVEQLELNRKIIDAIPNPMYYRNRDGIYMGVNSQFHEIIGTFEADVIGARPDNIFSFDIASRFNESERQLLTKPGSHNYEMRLKDVHGNLREMVVYEATFSDADNHVAGIVGLLLDVTKSKEMEAQLREAKAKADSTSKAKGEFLANMSHEIRTPMNAIIGMSHLVLNTKLSKQQMNYIKKIDMAANNLLGIINDVLDFSKIESGKMTIVNEEFDLEEVMTNVSVVNSVKAEDKGIELLLDIPSSIPTNLIGDSLRLGQVLINLCGNAIKFTEHGEVIITATVVELTADAALLRFSVKDSGIGLTKEQQDKLFKAFSQADSSITRKYGGTGLGLSISKRLVELMGGQIGVSSQPGVGSEFYFTVKVGLQAQPRKQWLCPESIIRNTSVLVVDDNDAAREIMSNLIKGLGFATYAVASAQEALDELARRPYQLVFTDWSMPEVDGCQLASRIYDLNLQPKPKIILVTAHSRELDMDEALIRKLDGIISKPINASIVFDCVIDCFDIKGREAPVVKRQLEHVSFAGAKVLLVEDNVTNQEVATEMLKSLDLHVTIANHGQEALEMLERGEQFELVFMDMQMPVMDGLTATKKIRAQPQFANLPIVAMTANAMHEDIERCMAAGMNAHISKPINFNKMVSTIDAQINSGEPTKPALEEATQHETEAAAAENSYELDGIDINEGLERIGGNEKAYWSILGKFIHKQIEELINLEQALIIGDSEHASRIAHSLKGSAANLSANYLVEQGTSFETQIKTAGKVDIEQLHEVIDYLRDMHEKLESRQAETQQVNTTDSTTMPKAKLDKLFTELLELVESNDVQAIELVDTLSDQDVVSKEKLEQLRNTITDFEFEKAKAILQELRGS
ncbi:hybrid sensor histidine kinase/response regulator [Pseudoalteromonas sp. T1lg23B]|uniref:hybrid sensor histidine kinase/response regulator n=1 Tax=Pseudoalteromonas sp. T1lg23B TaxID=2077097 RepID=UPI000CF71E0D|nr:hybrid sensor histidine kinase/response regulator [Pseudoalteromonas sp. T1lg23B]